MTGSNTHHKEAAFEATIEAVLLASGGFVAGDPAAFDRQRGLDAGRFLAFVQASPPKTWAAIAAYHGDQAGAVLLDDLGKAVKASGLLHVLRHGYLSQIIPYQDSSLERLYTYLRFLGAKLPRRDKADRFEPDGEVELKYYKLQKIGEGQIDLKVGEPEPLYGPDEVGSRRTDGEQVRLSSLVDRLNEKFGTHFTPADQLFFDQIEAQAVERKDIQQAAKANSLDDFKLVFDQALDGLFIDRMDGNDEIFRRVMSDEQFRAVAAGYLLQKVYGQARK